MAVRNVRHELKNLPFGIETVPFILTFANPETEPLYAQDIDGKLTLCYMASELRDSTDLLAVWPGESRSDVWLLNPNELIPLLGGE